MPAKRESASSEGLRYLIRSVGPRRLAVLAALMVLSSLTEGIGLFLLVPITASLAGETAGEIGPQWFRDLGSLPLELLLGLVVGLVTVRAVVVFFVTEERRKLGFNLTRQLRKSAQDAILKANWRWLTRQNSADHASFIVGEAGRAGTLADRALSTAITLITLTGLGLTALVISWRLTLLAAAIGAIGLGVVAIMRTRRELEGEAYSAAYFRLQHLVSNGLAHLRAARIAAAEHALAADFDRVSLDLEMTEERYYRSRTRNHFVIQVAGAVVLALVVWSALRLLGVPLAVLVPSLAVFSRVVPLASSLEEGFRSWQFTLPALDGTLRLIAEAEAAAEPEPSEGAPKLPFGRSIELAGVAVRFPGRPPVFEDFDLSIPKGAVVGVSGPSGSGKSTLADILAGMIEPDAGTIAIDGRIMSGEERIAWRRQVAYVEQVPYLFDGTIAQNLTWGLSGCDERAIARALDGASAGFALALPQGLQTIVGESGRQLSGGERQRLSLARALLREPDLLILDEITAALDAANEEAIRQTVAALKGRCTILILGHRATLLELADTMVDLGAMQRTTAGRS